jgi:hypothetical protein
VVGLAIDSGQLFIAKRSMQEAADAAAFAGAVVIYQAAPGTDPTSAVRHDGTMNGYTDGTNQTVVTVNWPPLSGSFIANPKYVEVIIVQQVKTTLVPAEAAFNPVRSRSVAGADPVKSPFALMALKPTGPCITLGGTGDININALPPYGGMAQANCTGNSITFGSGHLIDAVGTRTVGTVSQPSGVTGPLTQNASKQPDPFVAFPRPVVTGLPTFNNFVVPASACNVNTPLTPGVYTGGITNNQNCNVYLGNGPFILKGGGLSQNASSGNITTVPAGAMIFNTNSNYPAAGGTCGSIQAQSGGGFDIYAMNSGTYQGMALYQDAACGASVISVQSNGSYDFHGTVYAPTATIDLQSQSSITMHAQIVAYSINFQSSGNLNILYDPSIGANSGLPTIVE